MGEEEREMGFLVMDSLAVLLSGNSANASKSSMLESKLRPSTFETDFTCLITHFSNDFLWWLF